MRRSLLLCAVLGLLAADAFARAGGGQSYSGGTQSSGYSSSSSYSYSGGRRSGGGDLLFSFLYLYARFVAERPLIGIPMTLFIAWMIWLVFAELNANPLSKLHMPMSGGTTPEGGQLSHRKAEELARLRDRDPDFEEKGFLRRAGAAFLKIQQAWSDGDMGAARAFISDGVRERFTRQLDALKERGLRNLMEEVRVRDLELMACRSDKHFDALWVRVSATAIDRTVDASGAVQAGSTGPQHFEEVWTFLRRPGAKTLKRPGVIEGSCPSCGASLPIADAAQCASCKSWVNSGEYDWVLSEITQACEWVMREPARDVDGWSWAAAADPALNLAALEDKASVLFWRRLDAKVHADAAVGGVEVMAFEQAGPDTRCHVMVKWSARTVADGEPGPVEVRRHFFILRRARDAKTDARQGLRTARCPGCGAPTAASDEASCGYCGVSLSDGKKDWVLAEVQAFGEWRRPAGPGAASARVQPGAAGTDWGADMSAAEAFAVLARAMLADGEVTLAEKSFLTAYAKSRGLPALKADDIIAAARAGILDAPKAEDGAQAETMLRGMIRMSLADGLVSEAERSALHSFAGRFGLTPDSVQQMVYEEREAMGRSVRGVA